MALKVAVDQNTCIGCSACTMCDNFELTDDEGVFKARPKQEIVDDSEEAAHREAEETCPVSCITVEKQ